MATINPGVTGRRSKSAKADTKAPDETQRACAPALDDTDADTIPEFCRRHRISEAFYYKLRSLGLGPDETRLGARVIITKEAGAEWRAERRAATAAAMINSDS
jgi:hypothetical protein